MTFKVGIGPRDRPGDASSHREEDRTEAARSVTGRRVSTSLYVLDRQVYLYRGAAMLRKFTPLLSLLFLLRIADAQAGEWLQVRTPHFLVVSNSDEMQARRTARQFEAMRSVFQRVFPEAQLDTSQPMLILAVQNRKSFEALEPASFMGKGQITAVGFFLTVPERNYVLVQLNATGVHAYAPIYHEYAHFVFSRLNEWMPLWLTEGIAEFYQNTEILEDKVRLGKGDPYIQAVLEQNALLPLETLFGVDQHSPYYHEDNKGSIFYAESWALTHYLKDKDELENTHRINDYLDLLQENTDPIAAATQSFGDLNQLQLELRHYVITNGYALSELQGSIDIDDSSFIVQHLSPGLSDTLRADFLAHAGRESEAQALLQSVIRDDPANATAYELLGYIAVRQQKFEEARRWCLESIKLDPQNFAAHYWFAVAAIRKGLPDKVSAVSAEESLRTAIKLNPSFPFAYDVLAVFYATRGIKLNDANELMQTALHLVPGLPEVHADQAQVLAAMNRDKEAIAAAEMALKLSHTPEQTATIETVIETLKKVQAERKTARGQKVLLLSRGTPAGESRDTSEAATETGPKAIYAPQADYTEEARNANLEGTCVLSLSVGIDGKPSGIVVVKKLGKGLDQKAIEAVSQWRFQPARRYGRPVPTHLTLNLQFKLFGADVEKFSELSGRAKAGDAAAELELANAFFEGHNIPKDERQGMALLERAARSGLPAAQMQMGDRICGDGNDPDKYIEAYVWYALAQRGGLDQANAKVTELESRMTPDQLAEARKQLGEWHDTGK